MRIATLVMNVQDVRQAAEFWIKALGYVPREGEIGEESVLLAPKDGNGLQLALDQSDRTHLDLYVDSAEEQQAEVDRLVGLGAQKVDWEYPPDADFVVLADTEGQLFCIVDTSHG